MSCLRCGKGFDDVYYRVIYDKCRGKNCPDCGKVRKLSWYQVINTENPSFVSPCIKCKRDTSQWIDKICSKCFLERERKRGCVCFYDNGYDENKGHHNNINYYCSLCEETHSREALCKECFEKQTKYNENIRTFFKVILPTAFISLVIGFFLGWLFFKKLRKKLNPQN